MNKKIKLLILLASIIVVCIGTLVSEKLSPKMIDEDASTINAYEEKDELSEKTNNEVDSNSFFNTTDNDLFSKYYDEADKIISNMTLEEKVGQMFYARYPAGDATEEIVSENPGGYILFAKDFENETKASFIDKISTNQQNSKIKMFIGVDEEGGSVVRISKYYAFRASPFLSPHNIYNQGGMDLIKIDTYEKTNLLLSLGVNTNFAPVADIPTNQYSYIYDRAFSTDAELTSEYIKTVVEITNSKKLISVIKHFPGYGDNVDTHTGIATDTRTIESFREKDFKPFISGIDSSAPMIMVNHNIISNIDNEYPASLSKNVHKILRDELKFTGLIITDDLAMEAVSKYTSDGNSAVQAILAGNDMIITSNFKSQKEEVLTALKNKVISEEMINNSVRRIIACKLAYGIIENSN